MLHVISLLTNATLFRRVIMSSCHITIHHVMPCHHSSLTSSPSCLVSCLVQAAGEVMSSVISSVIMSSCHVIGHVIRSEVIFKKSSNLYCRLDLRRVLMVGTKVSKGFFV